ncbi:hypothetical protein M432DRAFT_476112 [Thermoascus aurantiacus ATCC 26904]
MILNPSHPSSFPPSPPAFRFPPAVEPALRVSRAPSEGTTAANAQHRSFYLFQPTPSAFVFPLLSNQRRSARSCAQALLARSPSGCSADEGVKKQEERRKKRDLGTITLTNPRCGPLPATLLFRPNPLLFIILIFPPSTHVISPRNPPLAQVVVSPPFSSAFVSPASAPSLRLRPVSSPGAIDHEAMLALHITRRELEKNLIWRTFF